MKWTFIALAVGVVLGAGGKRLAAPRGEPTPEAPPPREVREVRAEEQPRIVLKPKPLPDPALEDVLDADENTFLAKLARFLPLASTEDLSALCEAKSDVLARRIIFLRWAEIDVEGLLEWAREQDKNNASAHGIKHAQGRALEAYQAWAQLDPEAAFAAAREAVPVVDLASVLGEILRIDPRLAIELSLASSIHIRGHSRQDFEGLSADELAQLAQDVGQLSSGIARSLASAWVLLDPKAAFAWAESLENHAKRKEVVAAVLTELAEHDTSHARQLAESLPPSRARGLAILGIGKALAKDSPDSALAWARSLPPGTERQAIFAEVLNAVALTWEPRHVIDVLESMNWHLPEHLGVGISRTIRNSGGGASYSSFLGTTAVEGILRRIADEAPADAAGYALRITPVQRRNKTLGKVFEQWADADPTSAFEWATLQNIDAKSLEKSISPALQDWFAQSPTAALEWFGALGVESPHYQYGSSTLAKAMAESDAMNALQWAEALEAPGTARKAVWKAWIKSNPKEAGTRAVELGLFDHSALEWEARNLITNVAEYDLAAADSILRSIPEPRSKKALQYWEQLAITQGGRDIVQTSEWVAGIPPGTQRDFAITGLLHHLNNTEPDHEAAFAWSQEISETTHRERELRKTLVSWIKADPEKARLNIVASDLDSALKDELLNLTPES